MGGVNVPVQTFNGKCWGFFNNKFLLKDLCIGRDLQEVKHFY